MAVCVFIYNVAYFRMVIIGIDYGRKHVGVAIADGPLAEPLLTLANKRGWEQKIGKISAGRGAEKIVVGVPESGLVAEVRRFAKRVAEATGLPVKLVSETLSSHDARVGLRHKGVRVRGKMEHAAAATLILQRYMDSRS